MMDRSPRYSAIVFDLDGVLIDSEPIHLKAVEIMLARRGIRLTPEQAAQQTGITIHKFLERIVNDWGYPGPKAGEDWVAEKRVIFRQMAERELQPVAGADEFLRLLHGRIKIGLASSSPRPYIDWIVQKFGWDGIFDAICTIEDVSQPKPDPEMYRLIARRLGLQPRSILAFEDSPAGIKAAVAAGMDCIGVGTSYQVEELRAAGANWYISDFTDRQTLAALLGDEIVSNQREVCAQWKEDHRTTPGSA
ncbi:HAD family phosphatase [Candidatus Sumerlaeota bacterium]|nr:HAD family phosphatase [Candidatus Sumerlaeota bacterium]